jgi:hypothetical protein
MSKYNSSRVIRGENNSPLALISAVKLSKPIISLKDKETIAKHAARILNIGTIVFTPTKLDGLLPNQESGFLWRVDKYDRWTLHFVKLATKDGATTSECYLKMRNAITAVEAEVNQKLANACEGEFYQRKSYSTLLAE